MFDLELRKNISIPENNIGGIVQKDFESVVNVFRCVNLTKHTHFISKPFRKNFEEGLETAGASFAVYHKDKLLINLHGGYKNVEKKQVWSEDTTSVIFSTTKVCANKNYYILNVDSSEHISCHPRLYSWQTRWRRRIWNQDIGDLAGILSKRKIQYNNIRCCFT